MSQVYTAYSPLVQTICTHGFGGFRGFFSAADRDDGVQQIFLAAFEERTRLAYDGLKPYGSFLRGVAQNTIRRMLEKRTRFNRTDAPVPEPEAGVEERVIEEETLSVVRRFRASVVDPPEPEVLQLYFVEGMSEEALAERLGCTRYRLRKTIARIHKRMERYLRDHGVSALP
jgi:RNA polymerase sigma-70 factor (ECF subfamily)